ncbi:hypothetical protein PHLGIDRAFT_25944 [Phlebiopsis gigantea 11061_1 CR5-6]|uniref:DUF6534 domain-containing protein n=1 Tax=Phlebiopsis gigantea (strain 11061_1 CR5-6) TaxID=745531 RepID=A0A0C3NG96_PHLG1|nr:hypothetical protein PHLGIDRAFT_25944 [Phlebiopsis gigantea 11061_1 CR5-6]
MESPIHAVQDLLSPLLVLVCLALILYGMFTTQCYSYWFKNSEDSLFQKTFISTLWVLETVHTGLCIHVLYWYFITNLGEPLNALNIVCFYIWRIWKLSRSPWMTALPATLLVARIGTFSLHEWMEFESVGYSKILMNVGLVLASSVDILITVILTFLFRKHRASTSFKRTQHLVQQLMVYTINTGAFTTVCGIAALFMFNFLTSNLMFGGMLEILSKLYANSLLGMLNAREHLKDEYSSHGGVNTIPLHIRGSGSFTPGHLGSRAQTRQGESIQVKIHTEVDIDKNASIRPRDSASEPSKGTWA